MFKIRARAITAAIACFAAAASSIGCRRFETPPPDASAPRPADMAIADLHALCGSARLDIDEEIIIGGYVTSSDRQSNFYKSFTIEDATGGAEIMAGVTGLHNIYPEGYYVTVDLSGCAAGEHYGVLQIGRTPASYDYYPTAYFASRVVLDRHVTRSGLHRPNVPMPLNIEGMATSLCGRLVTVGGLRCVTRELYPDEWQANPEGRWSGYNFFADSAGRTVAVHTSEYADSAVPEGRVAITGILQYGKAGGTDMFMIKMRNENDCAAYD